MRLPPLEGAPIRVTICADLGPHLAATFIPQRRIQLDRCVLAQRGDFERILLHELFHFVWIRLSNATRREWSELLCTEFARGVRGELGWSAEWRKNRLSLKRARLRDSMWRRYTRESFCDTAAWCFSGLAEHDEFTLSARERMRRKKWFEQLSAGILKI